MVTDISKGRDSTVPVFVGLSTDTKPTDVDNGSEFREFDTGKIYYFDAENVEWCEQPGEGGGGGGDSGILSEIFPVCAKVTFVVSGVTEGHFPTFTEVGTSTGVLLVSDSEYGWIFTDELTVTNGTFEYYLLSVYESGELDYSNGDWDVSVSGGAELGEDGENAWVMVSGDCTITATKR